MTSKRSQSGGLLLTALTALTLFSHQPVHAFDPIPAPKALTPNTTYTIPALSCSVFTYTVPLNSSLTLAVSVAPAILALGYSPVAPTGTECLTPDSGNVNYVKLLDTTGAASTLPPLTNGLYQLRNVTQEKCWTRPVTLYFYAATGWSGAYGKDGSDAVKNFTVGDVVTPFAVNRTCSAIDPSAVPKPNTTTGGGGAGGPAMPTWTLLPPPPDAKIVTAGAVDSLRASSGLLGAVLAGLGFLVVL
ncbi:uncharacterized protein EV422DRAFT_545993 [Fimicolochytrium jonesii]|uniref:uncharacterized protein n=1 Tax=Fimicolochytrium jonesii TaxID=1396493 RepID=UPI0022FE4CAF|nr:uncharacterized protein EV422DRAFT_545993 [Fimicolochytrium jonesii]KAI8816433.1 hypothetical protein EV422DRAFT_545993 [Fimicolochytrium jonesii]